MGLGWLAGMRSSSRRESLPTREHQRRGLVGARFTLVFFGVEVAIVEACVPVARDLRIARTDAKHVHAACAVLDAFPHAMLVVSTTVSRSDRDVLEEHARRSEASVLWISSDEDPNDVVTGITSWVATGQIAGLAG